MKQLSTEETKKTKKSVEHVTITKEELQYLYKKIRNYEEIIKEYENKIKKIND